MAGWIRKGLQYVLLTLGAACGVSTAAVMIKAQEHEEQTATITYGQLQDIVADENPVITHLDISLLRGKRDFEEFVTIALGEEVDFSDRTPRYPALFDLLLRDQVGLHYEASRQAECTNELCYPPPPTLEGLIALAARITESNLEYDHRAHFILHTEQAFEQEHVLRSLVEFVIRSGEVGVEYAHVSRMAPDETFYYGKGMCEQYADVFNATLRRLNTMFGSPYDLSVGTIASAPGNPRNGFYEGLSWLLNLYYFHRNSGNVPHVSNIVIAHDPHHLANPRIYFVDPQHLDPFVDEDQIISVDRELFSRYDAALTLAQEYSVRAYARRHDFDPNGTLWDHIVVDDVSARILIGGLGLREDVVRSIRDNTSPTVLTLREIAALQRYQGEATMDGIADYFGRTGWLVSRLSERRRKRERDGFRLQLPDAYVGMPEDAGVPARHDTR